MDFSNLPKALTAEERAFYESLPDHLGGVRLRELVKWIDAATEVMAEQAAQLVVTQMEKEAIKLNVSQALVTSVYGESVEELCNRIANALRGEQ
jgi:KaiC/GvpD/RAD55 family RecA-like ATPase